MPKIDPESVPFISRTGYPSPFDQEVAGRAYRRLGEAGGLTQFGANIVRLAPGAWSSQRHWHEKEDEFVLMLTGEAVMVTDAGEEVMRPGDCACFAKGVPDGHHFVNRSDAEATFLVVGTKMPGETAHYPDVDLHLPNDEIGFTHKDGTPYPKKG